MYDILIIGGGLAGLVNAVDLSKDGLNVLVIEKNDYPKHKVCGEYVSKEVLPYLEQLGIHPYQHGATSIDKFLLSAQNGAEVRTKLPLGGFGISRYKLDCLLYDKAIENGCMVKKATVEKVEFKDEYFEIETRDKQTFQSKFVIGAYGKRSGLDVELARNFMKKKTPYLAVKSHYMGEFPEDLVALHSFKGGYCGVSKVENGLLNICYLTNYKAFKPYKNTEVFQAEVLCKNPKLKEIFNRSESTFTKPLTISQVSFSKKEKVDRHIFMSGDAAGMVHPLSGNGMGMAIHSAKILSQLLRRYFNQKFGNRESLEAEYIQAWERAFKERLRAASILNIFISNNFLLNSSIGIMRFTPRLLSHIVQMTHGKKLASTS